MTAPASQSARFAAPAASGYQPSMVRVTLRWVYFFGVIFLAGPLCYRLVSIVPAVDGAKASGALLGTSPFQALLGLIAAFAIAAILGAAAARLFSPRSGLFAAGLALAWTPWAIGRMDDLVRVPATGSILTSLSIEGAIVGALGVGVGAVVWFALRTSQSSQERAADPFLPAGLLGPLVAIGVGGIAAWAIARSVNPGQAFGAAVFAALFGVVVGKVVDHRSPDRAYLLSALVLAAVTPILASMGSSMSLMERVYTGALFPPAMILPLDWIAGALLGIPLGSAWASSMLEKRAPESAARTT